MKISLQSLKTISQKRKNGGFKMILKALKNIPSQNIKTGDTFKTESQEIFLKNGLARHLTKEEILSILDGYVQEAERVFNDTGEKQNRA